VGRRVERDRTNPKGRGNGGGSYAWPGTNLLSPPQRKLAVAVRKKSGCSCRVAPEEQGKGGKGRESVIRNDVLGKGERNGIGEKKKKTVSAGGSIPFLSRCFDRKKQGGSHEN